MKTNITALKSRYGNTDVSEEFLRYPFNSPIKYDFDYTGTYSKFSLVDKHYVDTLVKPHKRLISGGAEWSLEGGGMTFSVSKIFYTFTGEVLSYTASYPGLTFDAGDAQDRIDAVVINEGGQMSIVKGTPAASPARPTISDSQILVQYCYVNASATTIGSSVQVYSNNSQWTVTNYQLSGAQSGTYDPAFSGDDYLSGSSVQLNTDYRTGVKFTQPVGIGLSASQFGSLSMRIKFTSVVPDSKSLFAQVHGTANGAAVYGNTVNLMTFGLERDSINNWQHVVVPTSKFGSDFSHFNALTLRMAGGASGSNTLWRVDYILFQRGRSFDGYMGEPDATGGAGSSNAVTGGVIGPAEDGSYTDGVFTDFIPSTPIGTAIDRFNELFLALVPAPAPALTDWSGSRTGGVNGKLSFDDSNPVAEATYFGANTAPSAVSVDGSWTAAGKRLSIYAATNTNNISGTLASNTAADLGTPTPAYPANSFGDATTGNVRLSINGVIVSTASVSSTTAAINTTSGNTTSGLVLSAATHSKFPTGLPFLTTNPMFLSRTGTWLVRFDDARIRNGYNYVVADHVSGSFTRTLTRFEFVQDANVVATTFNNFEVPSFTLTGSKYLSGVRYYTGGTVQYDGTMSNLYRNTYYPSGDAVTFNDLNTAGNAGTNPHLTVSAQYSLVANGGNELRNVRLSTDFNSSSPLQFTLIGSGKRRLNDPIGLSTTAKRTLQGNLTGGTQSITNVYLDNVAASSNIGTNEGFDDEDYRLKCEGTGLSYSLISDISTNGWDSSQSLVGADAYHNVGLQVYNSRLIYPSTNFSSPGSAATNQNFGISNRDYSTATGQRSFVRYFYNATTYGNFTMTINGSGGTFVARSTALTGNNIWVELKLPGSASGTTGWLDCYTDFDATLGASAWNDGKGARKSNYGLGRAFGTAWGLTTGSRLTNLSGGNVVIRVTVAQGSAAVFTGITFAWG